MRKKAIDRIDNNKGYAPNNCRWTTNVVQANNRRTTIRVQYDDRLLTLKDIALELNISKSKLYYHFKKTRSLKGIKEFLGGEGE